MSSTDDAKPGPSSEIVPSETTYEIDPGVCQESVICPTDSYDDLTKEIALNLPVNELKLEPDNSTISEIKSEIFHDSAKPPNGEIKSSDSCSELDKNAKTLTDSENINDSFNEEDMNDESYLKSPELIDKEKHIIILSTAGKPIYSRYGNEDKLAGLCGVIQALVSVIEEKKKDVLRSIKAGNCRAIFLVKGPLILVAVSKSNESETQLSLQLTYAFNQIVSTLTLTHINKIFEQRRNYDLRRLLSGSERLIDHLLNFMERDPAFLLGAVRCLPLHSSIRDSVTSAITSSCNKIKDLVFAIMLADGQLITIVRMKKYRLHWSDLHLLFNLIRSSESFRSAETWIPICLPKFDATGFLHAHVSYLTEECQACLILLTVQKDAFFPLSAAKQTITEKLKKNNVLNSLTQSIERNKDLCTSFPLKHIGVNELRHFMYKCKSTSQLFVSDHVNIGKLKGRNLQLESKKPEKLSDLYYLEKYRRIADLVHCTCRPAKLVFRTNSHETILAWVTVNFELYVTFDSLIEKQQVIVSVDKLLRWMKKEEDSVFIMNAPTF